MSKLMLNVLADDRPGVVSDLAALVSEIDGNWLDSRLGGIGGKFGGIVLIEGDHDALVAQLGARDLGFDIHITQVDDEPAASEGQSFTLSVVGTDRPGIVKSFSRALADAGASIDYLQTATREGPWGAGLLFEADAVVRLPEGVELQQIRESLEAIADDLVVDIDAETEPEA